MRPLVFDIETISDLDDRSRAAIQPLAGKRDLQADAYASLCPPLARVACISWLDVANSKLVSAFDAGLMTTLSQPAPLASEIAAPQNGLPPHPCEYRPCSGEAELLAAFGAAVEAHCSEPQGTLVTFNGRGFDLPVLLHRGLIHDVGVGKTILLRAIRENRYTPLVHVDLMDVVTFCGAGSRWPLAAYAVGFGAASPKAEMDGSLVNEAVRDGRIVDVARYCATDVLSTAFLYSKVESLIAFGGDRGR